MKKLKLDIQLFADGKVVIETEIDNSGIKKGLKDTENNVNKAGSTVKGIIAGLGITKIISIAMNSINSSIDGAVKRVDTLNNFPKVMSNLGISSKDASKSINTLSDKLTGLPTTLNDAASAVQRLTSANGDIDKSTKFFLAMNNAILAGGASMDLQSSAMEQLSQAYAKGKPDAMEWRSILSAMPAQLKQMASELGYTSTAVGGDFYEAIQSGKLSMDEFMETMVKLNTKGTGNFASFEEQARSATGGIDTAVTNMKTSITRGVANMITQIDKGLEKYGGLSGVISKIGELAEKGLKKVGEYLPTIVDKIIKFSNVLIKLSPYIAPLVAGFVAINTALKAMEIIKTITTAFTAFNAVLMANPIILIVAGITALVAAFVLLWNKSETFRNFWIGLWEGIKKAFEPVITSLVNMFKEAWELIKVVWDLVKPYFEDKFNQIKAIVGILKTALTEAFKTAWEIIKGIWNTVGAYFKAVFDTIAGIFKVIKSVLKGDFQGAWDAIKSVFSSWGSFFKTLFNTIINIFSSIGKSFFNIGKNIVTGIWNGISGSFSWIKNKIKEWVGDVVGFFKKVLKIHSPSRLFADEIGSYMAQGLGMGFDNEIDAVYKDMQRAVNLETDRMSANVQSSGTYQMAMAGLPTYTLQDNSTNKIQLVTNGKVLAEVVNTENRNREVARA